MSSLESILRESETLLKEAGVEEYKTDAFILLQHVFKLSRGDYYLRCKDVPEDELTGEYRRLVDRRVKREPVQYITGHQEFMGLDFTVNPSVLIPRQDTEILVEQTLKELADVPANGEPLKVLDMCTGSGCIAVSLKKLSKVPVSVMAADVSKEALEVAKENAKLNGAEIEFAESDLFANVAGKFDFIVSNPPYIRPDEIEMLSSEVKDYEPRLALDGDKDGLFFYKRIITDGKARLNRGGRMIFEIGCYQGSDVKSLMEEAGFANVTVIKDLAGLDRVVTGRVQ